MTQKNRKNWMDKANTQENGSVLILALIMASILLSVGMGISNIALKEIKLSSIGDESGKAFYMADTAAECALYWDLRSTTTIDMLDGVSDSDGKEVFATSTDVYWAIPTNDIKCFNGINIAAPWNAINPARLLGSAVTTFTLQDTVDIKKPCAQVVVTKTNVLGVVTTTIDSRGQSSCDSTDPRRVERGLKVSY